MSGIRAIRDKQSQGKVHGQLEPLSKICFSFLHMTSNNRYGFKQIAVGDKIAAYESLFSRLEELSRIDVVQAHNLGKIQGMEKIPYVQLSRSMQMICDGTRIVTRDSKIVVFRFCNQKYRLLCKDDITHPNLMYVIAFDFDFSAYNHG